MKSQRATVNAAERKRSRSEANTGRRAGASFGLQLFFGRENRLRFSRRAGPSFCDPLGSRAPKPPTAEGRTASFAASLYPKPRRLRPLELRTNLVEWGGEWCIALAIQRGDRPNPTKCGDKRVVLGRAFATRRVAQFAATPCGGLQLDGARCTHRWRRPALTKSE